MELYIYFIFLKRHYILDYNQEILEIESLPMPFPSADAFRNAISLAAPAP